MGLAGDQVFLGNIPHMLENIGTQARLRRFNFAIAARQFQRVEGFERKLCVDHQTKFRIRQLDQAIGPGGVGEGGLEGIGAAMEAIADDRLHASLAIGAASLLVGENVLETHHFAGEGREIFLGCVDDGETLIELGERLPRAFGVIVKAHAEPLAHLVEPCFHGAGEVGLRALRLFGETAKVPHHIAQPVFKFRGAVRLGAPGEDNGRYKKQKCQHRARGHDIENRERAVSDPGNNLIELHLARD